MGKQGTIPNADKGRILLLDRCTMYALAMTGKELRMKFDCSVVPGGKK